MSLTFYERISLINQFKILKHLNAEPKESCDYKIKILERGYIGLYSEVFIELTEEVPERIVSQVFDILHMYSVVRYSYADLNTEEKEEIDISLLAFKGFKDHGQHQFVMDSLRKNGYFNDLDELDLSECQAIPLEQYLKLYEKFETFNSVNQISLKQLKELQSLAEEIGLSADKV